MSTALPSPLPKAPHRALDNGTRQDFPTPRPRQGNPTQDRDDRRTP